MKDLYKFMSCYIVLSSKYFVTLIPRYY